MSGAVGLGRRFSRARNNRRRSVSGLGHLTSRAMPKKASSLMVSQVRSISNQRKPWRAENGKAWWLLCQPSPHATIATNQLFVD